MFTKNGETLSHRALQDRLGASFPPNRPPAGWEVVTPPAPTLNDLKRRKVGEIENARDQDIAAGLVHNGVPVQTRPRDQINLLALVLAAQVKKAAGDTSLMAFRDGDNVTRHLTPDDVIAMGMAAMGYAESQYQRAWSLKDQARDAASEQDLDSINW